MRRIVPLLLALIGLGAGAGIGFLMRPSVDEGAVHAADGEAPAKRTASDAAHTASDAKYVPVAGGAVDEQGEPIGPEYVKLSNQFIVPIVVDGRVASMVILSLSLEVTSGSTEAVFAMEPKLRDRFLQVLFDHANAGGFKGSFTDGANLIVLRRTLKETAQMAAGGMILDVLIADIARQDS